MKEWYHIKATHPTIGVVRFWLSQESEDDVRKLIIKKRTLNRADYLKVKKMPNSTPLPECSPDEIMVERRTEFPFGRTFQPIVHEPEP